MPFGVADPVLALACPSGAAALLYKLAWVWEPRSGLRLLHLAKLFYLFNFSIEGTLGPHCRWGNFQELLPLIRDLSVAKENYPLPIIEREDVGPIAVISYCNYPNKTFILPELSLTNKQAYTKRHNYKFFHVEQTYVSQFHPWMNKLLAIEEQLEHFAWVMWADCDLFFMNQSITLENIILAAGKDKSLILTEDGNMLNTASFLLRNTEWGKSFLRKTIDLLSAPTPQSFQHHHHHEQSPLMYLSLIPSVFIGEKDGYDENVAVVPQQWMNSYPEEIYNRVKHVMPHTPYTKGDFIISFNGCGSALGAEKCDELFQYHHANSDMWTDK
eukprot:GEMP01040105.1.p1 GENE.GEMP01040105.1~~GEMP01040105.1.p1  ORF type:complete len:328 (+),score=65.96 GEMP01040105.1:332-1315(+)